MSEIFETIGFEVSDENSYNLLAEYADSSGERSQIYRGGVTLHGRCWKLGEGLEVWSVLYERGQDFYYADCRPAFRSRYVRTIEPWELIEYDEDGEAIVCGTMAGGTEVVFELQNFTEVRPSLFRQPRLQVALAGLAYSAQLGSCSRAKSSLISVTPCPPFRFEPAARLPDQAEDACENDYFISGQVLAWRQMRNAVTGRELAWLYVDAGRIRLEVIVSQRMLSEPLKIGSAISGIIWLQGHILEGAELSARYEGVDRDCMKSEFWVLLRRGN
jgi:hypothetical protein